MRTATRRQVSARKPARKAAKAGVPASEHQIRQRRHILHHAAKLFAEMGYATTTMDMLSAVTEMNKASLYYYFESKRDILFALLRETNEEAYEIAIPATKMKTAADGIRHLARVGIRHLYNYQNETKIFMQEFPYISQVLLEEQTKEILDIQRKYMKIVYEVLNQGVEAGEFRAMNVRLAGSLFVTWSTAPLRFTETTSQEEVASTISNLFLSGVCGAGNLSEQ